MKARTAAVTCEDIFLVKSRAVSSCCSYNNVVRVSTSLDAFFLIHSCIFLYAGQISYRSFFLSWK